MMVVRNQFHQHFLWAAFAPKNYKPKIFVPTRYICNFCTKKTVHTMLVNLTQCDKARNNRWLSLNLFVSYFKMTKSTITKINS